MKEITVSPVAWVKNTRPAPDDDYWGSIVSEIELAAHIPDAAFAGIGQFSHLEIIYHFDRAPAAAQVYAGHPRDNPAWPFTGIFAQRKKDRPNRLGLCTVQLLGHSGRTITVQYLDAIDGTPVLDIKPVFREFEPGGTIMQPEWATDLMQHYWK